MDQANDVNNGNYHYHSKTVIKLTFLEKMRLGHHEASHTLFGIIDGTLLPQASFVV